MSDENLSVEEEEEEEDEEDESEDDEEEDEEDEEDDESAARRGAGDESDAASSLVSGEVFGAAASAGARSLSADGAPEGSVAGASGEAAADEPGSLDRGPGASGVPDSMMIKMERIEIGDTKGSSILGDLKKQQKMSTLRREGGDVPAGGADALPDEEEEEAAAKRASADDPLAGLSEQELADHREIFGLVDTDGTGAIDRDELQRLMHMVGMKISEEQMEVVMQEVDLDGSGEVEFDEFIAMMERKQAMKYDLTQIHAAFRAIGDGLKHFPPAYAGVPGPSGGGGEPDDGAAGGSRDSAGGSRDERPVKEHYCPPDHIHVGHLIRAFVEYGSERMTEDEARACAEIFKPNEQGFVNWRVWVEKNFEGYT